jgi:hypothetical protein
MRIREILEGIDERLIRAQKLGFDTSTIWYHGSDSDFVEFDVDITPVNRTGNPPGVYLTPYNEEAEGYGEHVYAVYTSAKHPFDGQRKNHITPKMISVYRELLLKHTSYQENWLDTAILPDFKETGRFKSVPGFILRDVMIAGGYDSYKDGAHLCVFDPSKIRSIHAEFDPDNRDSRNIKD